MPRPDWPRLAWLGLLALPRTSARERLALLDALGPPEEWIGSAAGRVRAHGSALALLDETGALALPVMSYLADMPPDIAKAYAAIEPPFEEVLAPVNPGALTLARQLLWQETHFPDAFARVRTILPYAQYIACRLAGIAASEASASVPVRMRASRIFFTSS